MILFQSVKKSIGYSTTARVSSGTDLVIYGRSGGMTNEFADLSKDKGRSGQRTESSSPVRNEKLQVPGADLSVAIQR